MFAAQEPGQTQLQQENEYAKKKTGRGKDGQANESRYFDPSRQNTSGFATQWNGKNAI